MRTRHYISRRQPLPQCRLPACVFVAVVTATACGARDANTPVAPNDETGTGAASHCDAFLAGSTPMPGAGPVDLRAAYRDGQGAAAASHFEAEYAEAVAAAERTFSSEAPAEAMRAFFYRWVYAEPATLEVRVDRFVVPEPLAIGLACLAPNAGWLGRGGLSDVTPNDAAARWLRGE